MNQVKDYRKIRSLKNRRDTLIQNILKYTRIGDGEVVELNRMEVKKVNTQLIELGVQ